MQNVSEGIDYFSAGEFRIHSATTNQTETLTMNKTHDGQTRRLLEYVLARPNQDINAPLLNEVAAGDNGVYVSSFTRRVSDVRKYMQNIGGNFIKSKDEWHGGQRRTAYRLIPAP